MTIDRETVIRLARETSGEPERSGWGDLYIFESSELERFVALVLEHVRAIEASHRIANKESSDAG